MKILNLYAGIGGNRKLWPENDITAVELNPDIAAIYQDFFPDDKVIVADAHQYLLENFKDFDFIWASPPCPSHSKLRTMPGNKIMYPDMSLYQEIILLQKWYKGPWVIENVIPYYDPLIRPSFEMERHYFWSNAFLMNTNWTNHKTCKTTGEREEKQKLFGFNLDKYTGIDKRKVLRNCVVPEIGLYIFKNVVAASCGEKAE